MDEKKVEELADEQLAGAAGGLRKFREGQSVGETWCSTCDRLRMFYCTEGTTTSVSEYEGRPYTFYRTPVECVRCGTKWIQVTSVEGAMV